jgi:maltose/moltooligosaccharide transporter
VYSSGNVGAGMFFGFSSFVISLYLRSLGASAVVIGLLSSVRSFEGAIVQPIVGAQSDRTWTWLGRRRPYIVAFIPLCALLMAWTAFAPSASGLGAGFGLAPDLVVLLLVAGGIFIFSLAFNVAADPFRALFADITPPRERGRVNGVFQMAGAIGQGFLLLCSFVVFQVAGSTHRTEAYFVIFVLTAGALVISFVPTVVGIREPRALAPQANHRRNVARDYWDALRGERQVQLYFAAQFFLWFGVNAVTPFLAPYAVRVVGLDVGGASLLAFVLLGVTALFNWPFGLLADRLGFKRVFLLGIALMAGASAATIWVSQPVLLFGVLLAAGIGNAAQTTSAYPLLTRIVRPDRIGFYTGLNTAITSIAAPVSGAIAGIVIDGFGYAALLPFVAVLFAMALVPLVLLNPAAAEARVAAELHAGR